MKKRSIFNTKNNLNLKIFRNLIVQWTLIWRFFSKIRFLSPNPQEINQWTQRLLHNKERRKINLAVLRKKRIQKDRFSNKNLCKNCHISWMKKIIQRQNPQINHKKNKQISNHRRYFWVKWVITCSVIFHLSC